MFMYFVLTLISSEIVEVEIVSQSTATINEWIRCPKTLIERI